MSKKPFPYAVDENGEVPGMLWEFWVHGAPNIFVFIPDPATPEGGWKPGDREKYMATLRKSAIAGIRKTARQKWGATSVELVSETVMTQPLSDIANYDAGIGISERHKLDVIQ